jgi:hypothetical protein
MQFIREKGKILFFMDRASIGNNGSAMNEEKMIPFIRAGMITDKEALELLSGKIDSVDLKEPDPELLAKMEAEMFGPPLRTSTGTSTSSEVLTDDVVSSTDSAFESIPPSSEVPPPKSVITTNVAGGDSTRSSTKIDADADVDITAIDIDATAVSIPLKFYIADINQKIKVGDEAVLKDLKLLQDIINTYKNIKEKDTDAKLEQRQIFVKPAVGGGKPTFVIIYNEEDILKVEENFTQSQKLPPQQFSANTTETETKKVAVFDEIEHRLLPEDFGLLSGLDVGGLKYLGEKQGKDDDATKNIIDFIKKEILVIATKIEGKEVNSFDDFLKTLSVANEEELGVLEEELKKEEVDVRKKREELEKRKKKISKDKGEKDEDEKDEGEMTAEEFERAITLTMEKPPHIIISPDDDTFLYD